MAISSAVYNNLSPPRLRVWGSCPVADRSRMALSFIRNKIATSVVLIGGSVASPDFGSPVEVNRRTNNSRRRLLGLRSVTTLEFLLISRTPLMPATPPNFDYFVGDAFIGEAKMSLRFLIWQVEDGVVNDCWLHSSPSH
jgi:hypothetical protein